MEVKVINKSTYFRNVETLEELRKQYKELLKRYHPDNPGGSTKITKEINSEYDQLFKMLKNRHENKTTYNKQDSNQKSYDNMKYNFDKDEKLSSILQSIISFTGIHIEIIGC